MALALSRRSARRRALTVLVCAVAMLGPHVPQAATLSASATVVGAATLNLCAWPSIAIGPQRLGNSSYIDTSNYYLFQRFATVPGLSMRIQGTFPYARYMSITINAARSQVVIDHLTDADIRPDPGSTNPFRPFANRHATRRSYTLYIQQGSPPPSGRAPNTLYTGAFHPVSVVYRVYAPDQGADATGNAGKPRLRILVGTPSNFTRVIPLPPCASPRPIRPTFFPIVLTPLRWQRFGAGSLGTVNVDAAYLQARLNRSDADEYTIRFKAPTFEDTFHGHSITGRADVRYWSLCVYGESSTKVSACVHDYDVILGRNGYVNVLLSTPENRPKSATRANGINWLPFGTEDAQMVLYRQILPNPAFKFSILSVAPDARLGEPRRDMGRYFPAIQSCSLQGYAPNGCLDGPIPPNCSDLLEPVVNCTAAPAGDSALNRGPARAAGTSTR